MANEIIHVTAAGGVLCKAESSSKKVLLINRNGIWDLPKGKIEKGESIEECAVREVEEETGAENLSIGDFLCETYHEYQEKGETYGKTTYWYLMKLIDTDPALKPQTEEGITELKWVEPDKAKLMVGFDNLVKVLTSIPQKK